MGTAKHMLPCLFISLAKRALSRLMVKLKISGVSLPQLMAELGNANPLGLRETAQGGEVGSPINLSELLFCPISVLL
jgi:hypothetical protein